MDSTAYKGRRGEVFLAKAVAHKDSVGMRTEITPLGRRAGEGITDPVTGKGEPHL